jgi:hypothetical protein
LFGCITRDRGAGNITDGLATHVQRTRHCAARKLKGASVKMDVVKAKIEAARAAMAK